VRRSCGASWVRRCLRTKKDRTTDSPPGNTSARYVRSASCNTPRPQFSSRFSRSPRRAVPNPECTNLPRHPPDTTCCTSTSLNLSVADWPGAKRQRSGGRAVAAVDRRAQSARLGGKTLRPGLALSWPSCRPESPVPEGKKNGRPTPLTERSSPPRCACSYPDDFTSPNTAVSAFGRQDGEHARYMSTELFHELTEKPRGGVVEHLAVFGEDIWLIIDVGLGGVHLG
jgi:hypothetical protein